MIVTVVDDVTKTKYGILHPTIIESFKKQLDVLNDKHFKEKYPMLNQK